jgi:DNA gyrase subunit A
MGRATQGVKLIRLNEGDAISSVEKIQKIESEETEEVTDTPEIEGGDQNESKTEE